MRTVKRNQLCFKCNPIVKEKKEERTRTGKLGAKAAIKPSIEAKYLDPDPILTLSFFWYEICYSLLLISGWHTASVLSLLFNIRFSTL